MNLNTICSFPKQVANGMQRLHKNTAYSLQTVSQNKKTIIVAGIIGYVAIAAILQANEGRHMLRSIKNSCNEFITHFNDYDISALGKNTNILTKSSSVDHPHQCLTVYTTCSIHASQIALDLDSTVKELYNKMTDSGKDLFSSYGYIGESIGKEGNKTISLTICKMSLEDSFNAKISKISNQFSSGWEQIPYNKDISSFISVKWKQIPKENVLSFFSSISKKMHNATSITNFFNISREQLLKVKHAFENKYAVPWDIES